MDVKRTLIWGRGERERAHGGNYVFYEEGTWVYIGCQGRGTPTWRRGWLG
jgi:hypothetical protein